MRADVPQQLEKDGLGYASKEEVVSALENAYREIKDFYKKLLHFSLKWIKFYFNDDSIRGSTAADVVQNVFASILELQRKWYRAKIPDFHKFLRLSILSYIRNEHKRKKKPETIELWDENGNLTEECAQEIFKDWAHEDLNDDHIREKQDALLQRCKDDLQSGDDIYAAFVLDEISKGSASNIEIAKNLEITVREVENAKKRIRRMIERLSNS